MAELIVTKGNPIYMGTSKQGRIYNFAYCSDATEVYLLIVDSDFNEAHRIKLDSSYKTGDVFAAALSGVSLDKYFYCYEVDGVLKLDP